jgi:predicted O-linked N-acetylglucosamine transferase (SPINDLY family)
MPLALPTPTLPPPGATRPGRAFRRWHDGQAEAERGSWPEAARVFGEAFRIHPDGNIGLHAAHALICAGQPDAAIELTHDLRRQQPGLALAYTLESHALLERGRAGEAADCLRSLPPGSARDQAHWVALGVALQRCAQHDEAIGAFMQALALKMDDPMVHFRLGMSFRGKGMKAEAAECVRTAILLGLDSSMLAARSQLVFLEREACRWPQAEQELTLLRAAVQAAPADLAAETGPFTHAVLVDDPLEQLKVARHYAKHVAQLIGAPLPRRAAKAHSGRLRIAYLSSDFHQHATSQLMVQMLECHDRSRYEVFLVSAGPDDGSAMRRRVVAAAEHFEELRGQGQRAIAEHIRGLGIDILVDAKGATFDTLMRVTAYRAAPVQVSWLGFPGTTGADYVDYFIGDRTVTPLDHAAYFSEQIAQMPACYQPNDALRVMPPAGRRADWGLPEDKRLLCAFHQSYKISPEVFDHWCEILRRVPDTVLWLLQWNTNVQSALVAAAQARGIPAERLLFAPLLSPDEHLSRLACADVYLDAWPCNAHTTAGEALWVGVPVVTLIGQGFAQRVAASLLDSVALPELVCSDRAQYVDRVVALSRDAPRRAALRDHLVQQRRSSPLFDGARFARDIEALYERMWARAVAGLPPAHLPAA